MSNSSSRSITIRRPKPKQTRQDESLNELFIHLEQVEEEIEALKLLHMELQSKIAAQRKTCQMLSSYC